MDCVIQNGSDSPLQACAEKSSIIGSLFPDEMFDEMLDFLMRCWGCHHPSELMNLPCIESDLWSTRASCSPGSLVEIFYIINGLILLTAGAGKLNLGASVFKAGVLLLSCSPSS